MVELLLKYGADSSLVEKRRGKNTTLHVAATVGNKKMMKLLIENGFDLEKLVNEEAIVSLFDTEINWMTVFLILCDKGDVECLDYLLSVCAFVDIERKDRYNRNGIVLSILSQQVSMVKYLITKVYDKSQICLELVGMIKQGFTDQCQLLLDAAQQAQVVKLPLFF